MRRRKRRQSSRLRDAAIPLALTLLGVVVLGAALIPLRLPSSNHGTVPAIVLPPIADADFDHPQESLPQRAGAPTPAPPPRSVLDAKPAILVPEPTPRPAVRAPVPVDARPVDRAAAVAGTSQTWIAQTAARTTTQLEVAVVSQDTSAEALARDATSLLLAKGVHAFQAKLSDVRRPDVILLLDASGDGASVWYCSPSQSASAVLASTLLEGLAPAVLDRGGEDVSRVLPCDTLHLGRASSAAALVRVSPEASDAAARMVASIERYLDENADNIRLSRQSLRMTWPAIGAITSHYGPDHPLGIDIGQSKGAIVAATDGTVIFAGGDPCCSYGRFVVIAGPSDLTTVYAHLETIAVKQGDTVKLGQIVGEVGCTGRCFGTHLHFEVLREGVRQNPMDYLP